MSPVSFEATPNPQTMKFLTTQELLSEPMEFKSANEALASPLATKLFGFPWLHSLYIGRNFVTVTKHDWVEWDLLSEPLAELIQEHLDLGEPILVETVATPTNDAITINENDSEEVKIIKTVLNDEIRPAVAMDGGDVLFDRFEDNIVYLHMRGSCAGCPSSTMTLKMGIETRLKEAVPSISEVVSV